MRSNDYALLRAIHACMQVGTNTVNNKPHYWFFVGRSIGVALLGLYALRSVAGQRVGSRSTIILTDTSPIYEELLFMYPDIRFVRLKWQHPFQVFRLVMSHMFQKNIVMFPPSFGQFPFTARLFGRLITLSRGSRLVGYAPVRRDRFPNLITHQYPFSLTENIFSQVGRTARDISMQYGGEHVLRDRQLDTPTLKYAKHNQNSLCVSAIGAPYIVFHPYAATDVRTNPHTRSVALLKELVRAFPSHRVVVSGGPKDRARAHDLLDNVPPLRDGKGVFIGDIAHKLAESVQVVAGAHLYIGVDTGITHVAAHVGTPSVVIGNNSNPMWLPTYGEHIVVLTNTSRCRCTPNKQGHCRAVYEGKEYLACMIDIPIPDIVAHAKKLYATQPADTTPHLAEPI
jgi:hypothetical protein